MKTLLRFIIIIGLSSFISCEDYLDKSPQSDISEDDVFKNFVSFQGFAEQMYNCVMDPNKGRAWNNYLFADETLGPYPYQFDYGNYWGTEVYFYGGDGKADVTSLEPRDRRIWHWAWYGIRIANIALEKLEQPGLFEGSLEERNHLKGQALFFRGWFYFEICRFWGGMPYVTKALYDEELTTEEFNRLNFQETAKLMAQDFRAAADLLPNHWDVSAPGQATLGHNRDRINKFHALGYLGKSLLYAASPMINEEATGKNEFDPDLAKQAAEAFGELLSLADQTGIYRMQTFETRTDCFWKRDWLRPGGTESIMMPIIYNRSRVRASSLGAIVPATFNLNSSGDADVPTHNITKNYAMANGLPIDDPQSEYNPNNPWVNREPRFYQDIVKDGDLIHRDFQADREAQLYNGGRHRDQRQNNPPSVTGYYARKFSGIGPDFNSSVASSLQSYVPYLRMADIYLMYAEAVLFARDGGVKKTSDNYYMTAEDALNVVRNRAKLPNVQAKYTTDTGTFFEEIVRERAVELSFEGARFCDLRRWNRNDDPRYLDKTAIDFDRDGNGNPINLSERVIVRRAIEKKHNWLPIQPKFTKIYRGFPQNPGW